MTSTNKITVWAEKAYRWFFPTKKDFKENRQDNHHNGYKDANCQIWLFFSLFNEILPNKPNDEISY